MKDRNNKNGIDCVDWSIASSQKSVAPWRGTSQQGYERNEKKKNRKEARRGVPKVTHRNVSKDSESKMPGGSAVRSLLKRSLQSTSEWKFSTVEVKPIVTRYLARSSPVQLDEKRGKTKATGKQSDGGMSTFRLAPSYSFFHTLAPLSRLQAKHNQSHTKLDVITIHNEEKK